MKCSRCDADAITDTRGENFCESCYYIFLSRKFRAAMGDFRVNGIFQRSHAPGKQKDSKELSLNKPPVIIVFTSFGSCSLALIDLLLDMQEAQKTKNNGMYGFEIHLAHIGTTPEQVRENWPWKNLEIHDYPLISIEDFVDASKLSRSSRQDMQSVLIRQTAIALAHNSNATAIFGYSITRLSELTLAETIKGRGAGIPELVSPDLHEDHCVYPLKEVTLPEIQELCRIRNIDQYALPEPVPPGITKLQSIDEIVHQYFASVQENFPSVVSTVAKVASRLSQPPEACALCNESVAEDSSHNHEVDLCYACSSALNTSRLRKPLDILKEYEL